VGKSVTWLRLKKTTESNSDAVLRSRSGHRVQQVARHGPRIANDGSDPLTSYEGCKICESDQAFLRRSARPGYENLRPTVRVADLFCGCGAMSLGMAEAARRVGLGIKISMALDNDEDAVAVYRSNFPGADARCSSVEEIFDGQLGKKKTRNEEAALENSGPIDILMGGPPCQGSSDLNNHTRRNDPRNALYIRMARAAWVLNPRLVILENVPSIRHDVGKVLDITIRDLKRIGFKTHDLIIDMATLGAPQRRRRHILFACRDPRIDPQSVLASLSVRCAKHSARSVGWAIGDLVDTNGHLFDMPSGSTPKNIKRIAFLFRKNLYDLPNNQRPLCHRSDHSYRSMYGRLRWEEPAQTVTTGFGSMGQGRYVHPTRPRVITPHEAARLQMLPDFFSFHATRSRGAIAKMIGNCVPPSLGVAIGELVLRRLFNLQEGPRE
jgi:DNA (cytosine-5)-methyltransferase 1